MISTSAGLYCIGKAGIEPAYSFYKEMLPYYITCHSDTVSMAPKSKTKGDREFLVTLVV